VQWLKYYGFDVLDDYIDHSYDSIVAHFDRLEKILDQVEAVVDREYTNVDYARFEQAAVHNRQLLKQFEDAWAGRFQEILKQIKQL
jgi:hypothetical protein